MGTMTAEINVALEAAVSPQRGTPWSLRCQDRHGLGPVLSDDSREISREFSKGGKNEFHHESIDQAENSQGRSRLSLRARVVAQAESLPS